MLPSIREQLGDARPMSHLQDAVTDKSRAVVLVEGISDKVALETLATRRGRDLLAEDVAVVPIGGAQAIGRFLSVYRHEGSSARLAGLCDAGEERDFRLALERTGFGHDLKRADMERLGFYVCEADLEDELVRCLGADVVEEILAVHRKLVSFRTYQKQPAHRARSREEQLRGFLNNWKIQFAAPLVDALDLGRVPRPLDRVLAHVSDCRPSS
jgi:hypothetical protein